LFRYMRGGKARATGLGSLETVVGPAEAREKACHARQLLRAQGIDPMSSKKSPNNTKPPMRERSARRLSGDILAKKLRLPTLISH
jgi:hypothetical protein